MRKYIPSPAISSPAPLRNQALARPKEELASSRRAVAVGGCRGLGKRDMVHNNALPRIEEALGRIGRFLDGRRR